MHTCTCTCAHHQHLLHRRLQILLGQRVASATTTSTATAAAWQAAERAAQVLDRDRARVLLLLQRLRARQHKLHVRPQRLRGVRVRVGSGLRARACKGCRAGQRRPRACVDAAALARRLRQARRQRATSCRRRACAAWGRCQAAGVRQLPSAAGCTALAAAGSTLRACMQPAGAPTCASYRRRGHRYALASDASESAQPAAPSPR